MKYRKIMAALTAVAVMCAGVAACSKDSDDETTKGEETEASETDASETMDGSSITVNNIYCVVNGVEVYLGGEFAAVKDSLGDEIKPEERVEPCTGECEYLMIIHTYDGFVVNENYDGLISSIELNAMDSGIGDGKLFGQFGYGDSMADAMAYLGTPFDQGEGYAQYSFTTAMIMLNSDDNETISSISVYDFALGM